LLHTVVFGIKVHPEIQKSSPQARALSESGVGKIHNFQPITRPSCEPCHHTETQCYSNTVLLSNMLMTLRYLLANTAQLISLKNMKISVAGLSKTNSLSILTKQKKLFFIGLLLCISIFPLLCQTLNELLRLLYLELTTLL